MVFARLWLMKLNILVANVLKVLREAVNSEARVDFAYKFLMIEL